MMTQASIDRALRQSQQVEKMLLDPFGKYFEIRLGLQCNNHCTHCFISDRKKEKEKTFEDIKNIIDTIDSGFMIGVTGGEPTIRKDFPEILKYIKSRGNTSYAQTHGRQFANPEFTREVCGYLDGALVAIHSHIPEIHDEITGAVGSGLETWQGMKNIMEDGRTFLISQTVIVRKNYDHLLEIADAIQEINPSGRMSFTFPHPIAGALSRDITPTLTEIRPYLQKLLAKWGKKIQTHYLMRCYLYPYQDDVFNVDNFSNGKYKRPSIDVLDGDWKVVDYGIDVEKIKSPLCIQCKFDADCPGVWRGYGELYPDLDLVPIKETLHD